MTRSFHGHQSAANILNAILSSLPSFCRTLGIIQGLAATVFSRLVGTVILWQAMETGCRRPELQTFLIEICGHLPPATGGRLMMRAGIWSSASCTFGTAVVGGNAIGETSSSLTVAAWYGVAAAAVILVANSLGRGIGRDERIMRESYLVPTFLMVLVSGVSCSLARVIRSLYR